MRCDATRCTCLSSISGDALSDEYGVGTRQHGRSNWRMLALLWWPVDTRCKQLCGGDGLRQRPAKTSSATDGFRTSLEGYGSRGYDSSLQVVIDSSSSFSSFGRRQNAIGHEEAKGKKGLIQPKTSLFGGRMNVPAEYRTQLPMWPDVIDRKSVV